MAGKFQGCYKLHARLNVWFSNKFRGFNSVASKSVTDVSTSSQNFVGRKCCVLKLTIIGKYIYGITF